MDRRPILTLLLALLPACTFFDGNSHVFVSSEPEGARVFVDDVDTGQATPTRLDLDGFFGDDHTLRFELEGHTSEQRLVSHRRVGYTSKWIDGTDYRVFSFPLWWTLGDWFTPFAIRWTYVPNELHVVLYPEGEGPVAQDYVEPAADAETGNQPDS